MSSGGAVVHRGITIRQRGKRWRWQVRVGGRNVVRSAPSLEEAIWELDDLLDRREQRRLRRTASALKPVTVGELCDGWFLHKTPELAPATVRQYGIHIRVHIKPAIGDADANTIKPRELDDFYRSLRWKPAKESHNILRQSFDWGLRNEVLVRESNPCLVVRPSRRSSTDHDGSYDTDERILPVDEKSIPRPPEVEKLILDAEHRDDDPWWIYLHIATATGARPGEVCALQREHLDVDACTIHIEWSADRVSGRIKRPKTPHSVRTLQLDEPFFDTIADYLPDEPDAFLFPSNTQPGAVSPLPCWNSRGVKRRLDRALERTGLPHYTPHSFRHYVATHLLADGRSPAQVARFLGHADDTLVRKLYGRHIVDEAQREIGAAAASIGWEAGSADAP